MQSCKGRIWNTCALQIGLRISTCVSHVVSSRGWCFLKVISLCKLCVSLRSDFHYLKYQTAIFMLFCSESVFHMKSVNKMFTSHQFLHSFHSSFNTGCTSEDFILTYEGVSKSFRTGRLERELQMVQLSATGCSCITILCVLPP
jgi:hypothetical protein